MLSLQSPLGMIKGVGNARADLLQAELGILTIENLLTYFPFRYEDRTQFSKISDIIDESRNYQLVGSISHYEYAGEGPKKRLVAKFYDGTQIMDLLWFQSTKYAESIIKSASRLIVYGKGQFFNGRISMVHPEIEAFSSEAVNQKGLMPVYNTTERMKTKRLDSRALSRIIFNALGDFKEPFKENLPRMVLDKGGLVNKDLALRQIHFPMNWASLEQARRRIKFEELLHIQLIIQNNRKHNLAIASPIQVRQSDLLSRFASEVIPYKLTEAQRKVVKEIWEEMKSGKAMNRLLQGDVGSGKTVVAFICCLMVIGSGYQACMLAPTEILAEQHYATLSQWCNALGIHIEKLTGSVPKKARGEILQNIASGKAKMVVGTHALIQPDIQFQSMGLAVIDEQHRFGVDQRATIRLKGYQGAPHVLVMTATPIPRTLSLTLYGDLDISVIDQLPAGRKEIRTVHRYDKERQKIYEFLQSEISAGRQVYIVYPLIEESEKLNLKNLEEGVLQVKRNFPDTGIGVVHGRMTWPEREGAMKDFLSKKAMILVATTVIEVGVNVPNASVMVIENAERFGLSQLHQLRGRVGRGNAQSYCILLTSYALSNESRTRLQTMVESTDGFYISEVDMKLRGAGDMMGTRQSGSFDFLLASLVTDNEIVEQTKTLALEIIQSEVYDEELQKFINKSLSENKLGNSYFHIG